MAYITQNYEKLIEIYPDCLIVTDCEGKILDLNQHCCHVLGYTKAELCGTNIQELLHQQEDNPIAVANLQSSEHSNRDVEFLDKNSQVLPFQLSTRSLARENDSDLIVVFAKDITCQRLAEKSRNQEQAQIVAQSRLSSLREMAGNIAHEINNPIAIIHGLTYQIRRKIQQAESPLQYDIMSLAAEVDDNCERMSNIIKGLKSLSHRGDESNMEKCSVKGIITKTIDLCRESYKARGIGLHLPILEKDIILECHEIQISQVLLNLLNNAKDWVDHKDEKWVKIDARASSHKVMIEMSDSGDGVSPKNYNEIFQPFFSLKSNGQGTGLGLSISKTLVENHQGRLFYDENSPVSKFVILLPLEQAA